MLCRLIFFNKNDLGITRKETHSAKFRPCNISSEILLEISYFVGFVC